MVNEWVLLQSAVEGHMLLDAFHLVVNRVEDTNMLRLYRLKGKGTV